jgi:hypothetical protein
MGQPIRLRPAEPVRLERARLSALVAELGPAQAEEVICRAMEALAVRLALIERAYAAGDGAVVARGARSLVAIAEQLGMAGIARVARDVADCARSGDGPALAATLQRLLRQAEGSLLAVWEQADPSG